MAKKTYCGLSTILVMRAAWQEREEIFLRISDREEEEEGAVGAAKETEQEGEEKAPWSSCSLSR